MRFMQALKDRWSSSNSLVCVGLDPEPAKFPKRFAGDADAVFAFCRDIADATAQYACAFKPQIAHFAALGAEDALLRLIAHLHATHPGIPVILDAKRGDIGSTAEQYAREAFDRYAADAVTANPVSRARFGAALPRSRRSRRGHPLPHVESGRGRPAGPASSTAARCTSTSPRKSRTNGTRTATARSSSARRGPNNSAKCARSSATCRSSCRASARRVATPKPSCATLRPKDGTGLLVSSSRAILYASSGDDYAEAAARAARDLRDTINAAR